MIEHLGDKGPIGTALRGSLRKKRLAEQGKRKRGVIHPSELSICARKAQYSYWSDENSPDKIQPKEDDRLIFQLGSWLHDVVQEMLIDAFPNGVVEKEVWDPTHLFYGHCDFLIPGERAVEIKTVSANVLKQLKHPRESHIKQCSIYGGVLQVPICNLFYICRENGKWQEFEFETDIVAWAEMCSLAHDIIAATSKDQLVDGTYSYMICKSCGYRDACELWEYRS